MDSTSRNDSDGGGGRHGWSPGTPRDEGIPQQSPPDLGSTGGPSPQAPSVLSLDQLRITGSSNEYTEGPIVAQRSPASLHKQQQGDVITAPSSRTNRQQEAQEEGTNNLLNLRSLTQHGNTSITSWEGVPRSSSAEDSQSSIRISVGSASSGQKLHQIIRTQPKRADVNSEELKPLNDESRGPAGIPCARGSKSHNNKCEECGRCRCPECSRPRVLPSCWTCGRRCVCSAQSAVEYGTCVCCVKGLFYHCSSDDEDTCADKPFSCTQSRRCMRWTAVALLCLPFPCLLCYLPAKGCVSTCQSCYDRVARPGCRCKKPIPIHCEDAGKPT